MAWVDNLSGTKIDRTRAEGPAAEFVALREEIQERFKAQQTLLSLQLTTVAAIFGFAISRQDMDALLLIVPFTSYLLCGRQVAQHFAGQRLAQYIMEELTHRIPGGLGWEQWLQSRQHRPHILGSTLPLLLTYTGTSSLSLAWTLSFAFLDEGLSTGARIGIIAIWLLGLAVSGLSTVLVLQMASRIRGISWERASLP